MKVDNFKISNASLKELIITDVPFSFQGSIRRAFPELTCFCGGGQLYGQTVKTYPAVFDLFLISDTLKEIVLNAPKDLPALQTKATFIALKGLLPSVLMRAYLYQDLLNYLGDRTTSDNCALGIIIKVGANLSKFTANGLTFTTKTAKPVCFQEDNSVIHLDLTGTHMVGMTAVFIGLKKLKYYSVENTGITKLSSTFLQHYPSLEVIKLSKLNIGDFVKSSDEQFFGSCPTLTDIYLDDCNITNIPKTTFSRSTNLQRLDVSKNYLRTFYFDLKNCTRLNILNFSRNDIESITQKRTSHLTQLAL